MIGNNPVLRRFAWLHDQWVSFAENADARVLCWQLEDDEHRMVDAFLTKEEDDEIGELPDVFLRFVSPFEQEAAYGFALREELLRMSQQLHAAGHDEFAQLMPFRLPPLSQGKSGVVAWREAAVQFHAHYQLPAQLVIVLNPYPVSDLTAFSQWLLAAAKDAPSQLRYVVLDGLREPAFSALCSADPKRVVAQRAALDMPGALADTSRNAGELNTPGGMFRQLFVTFSGALGRRDLVEAEQLASRVLTIADAQGWHALALPVHMALAAVLAGEKRSQDANARYLAAEQSAIAGEQAGDTSCAKLRVQARMARGGLLISDKAYVPAAELYEETLPLALAVGDARMVIDCQRLASFSREQAGDLRAALRHGVEISQYARNVDFETRKTSTLPFVGEAMERLAKKSELRPQATRTAKEIDALMEEPKAPAKAGEASANSKRAAPSFPPSAPDT